MPRRLQFNDTVEVYYYPENKEQHNHHDSDFEFEEESLACGEDADFAEVQESADPDFEEMLQDYIKRSLLPRLQEESSTASHALGKRLRRSRTNSLGSVTPVKLYNEEFRTGCNNDSDSDKSLSTNENSCPTSGPSSGLNSATGAGATSPKASTPRGSSSAAASGLPRSYEAQRHELKNI